MKRNTHRVSSSSAPIRRASSSVWGYHASDVGKTTVQITYLILSVYSYYYGVPCAKIGTAASHTHATLLTAHKTPFAGDATAEVGTHVTLFACYIQDSLYDYMRVWYAIMVL